MEIATYFVRCRFGDDPDMEYTGEVKVLGLSAQDAADEARETLKESFMYAVVVGVCRSCEGEGE